MGAGQRLLVVTDRTELDDQIEGVFLGVGENIVRTKSGVDLLSKLNATSPRLMCSLVHKFGGKEEDSTTEFIEELKKTFNKVILDFDVIKSANIICSIYSED